MCPDLVLVTSHSCIVGTFLLDVSFPFSLLMPDLLVDCSMFSTSCWRRLLFICLLLCSTPVTLFNGCLLLYAAGFLLMLLSKFASRSVVMLDCLFDWCCRYVSAVTVVGFMCHLFCVMCLQFVVSWIVYDLLW